ncbi:porin family protein [Ideonella livida]|uniref:Porin family protein n=1 Tax=Ideonella livida TaxID=2707176 RepID=A0A7C9TN93_9BURK|nr:porin family protein [Ideonella livida]NDY93027.1 porin family protein [Ideonella livida]
MAFPSCGRALPALISSITLALGLGAAGSAQAEDFYLKAGVGRVRASGMSDASLSAELTLGLPLRRELAVEINHVRVLDVGSWFDDQTGPARRVFSSHTGAALAYHYKPNPSVRLDARLGVGTTQRDGSDSTISGDSLWELSPGVGISGQLRRDLRLGLELRRYWRSEVNLLGVSGSWLF